MHMWNCGSEEALHHMHMWIYGSEEALHHMRMWIYGSEEALHHMHIWGLEARVKALYQISFVFVDNAESAVGRLWRPGPPQGFCEFERKS